MTVHRNRTLEDLKNLHRSMKGVMYDPEKMARLKYDLDAYKFMTFREHEKFRNQNELDYDQHLTLELCTQLATNSRRPQSWNMLRRKLFTLNNECSQLDKWDPMLCDPDVVQFVRSQLAKYPNLFASDLLKRMPEMAYFSRWIQAALDIAEDISTTAKVDLKKAIGKMKEHLQTLDKQLKSASLQKMPIEVQLNIMAFLIDHPLQVWNLGNLSKHLWLASRRAMTQMYGDCMIVSQEITEAIRDSSQAPALFRRWVPRRVFYLSPSLKDLTRKLGITIVSQNRKVPLVTEKNLPSVLSSLTRVVNDPYVGSERDDRLISSWAAAIIVHSWEKLNRSVPLMKEIQGLEKQSAFAKFKKTLSTSTSVVAHSLYQLLQIMFSHRKFSVDHISGEFFIEMITEGYKTMPSDTPDRCRGFLRSNQRLMHVKKSQPHGALAEFTKSMMKYFDSVDEISAFRAIPNQFLQAYQEDLAKCLTIIEQRYL